MGYFAKIDAGVVTEVISISNDVLGEPTVTFPDTEGAGRAFIANTLRLEGEWRQTSFNGNFRGTYAGIGYTFDAVRDVFIAQQPYPSWTLDEQDNWQPPVPYPSEGVHTWDEEDQAWVLQVEAEPAP
jgi:hypothetical protein